MAKRPMPWRVQECKRNVHEFHLLDSMKAGSEAWLLWMSDEHWDHPKCNLDLLKTHHNEAAERGALIVKAGDTFCAMQGKGDPRGDKGSVREEHWGGNYIDLLVKTAAEWYAPWKDNIALIGLGNHETSVYKHHETCLVDRLCQSLRDKGGITHKGGYTGWVRVRLTRNKTVNYSYTVYYNHGFGGGGPVTKGAIDYNRKAEQVVADAIVMGHVHYMNMNRGIRERLDDNSVVQREDVHYIRCGTYKDEYEDGHSGFHVEKGRGPRPLGAWWSRFYIRNGEFRVDWIEAKE